VGAIHVHEFISLDGVVDAPTWTFDYGFHPRMGAARWSERCSPTASSTSCICSSIRSPVGPARDSFPEDATPAKLSLATCESYENGVVYLSYRPEA
jgi:hypothetical protein